MYTLAAWHRECGVADNRRPAGRAYLGRCQVQQRDLFRIFQGLVARCRAQSMENKCFSLSLPLLSKLWSVQDMSKLVAKFRALFHSRRGCPPSFWLLHTATHLDSTLAQVAGPQCFALGGSTSLTYS